MEIAVTVLLFGSKAIYIELIIVLFCWERLKPQGVPVVF